MRHLLDDIPVHGRRIEPFLPRFKTADFKSNMSERSHRVLPYPDPPTHTAPDQPLLDAVVHTNGGSMD